MTEPTPARWRTALWRGETAPIPVVRTPTRAVYPRRHPGADAELAAVDHGVSLALRVGTLLLAGGAPTEDVEAAIFAVGTAVGLGTFEVDITYGSIIISVAPEGDRPGLTDMRVVRGRSTHYARVAAAHQLVLDLAEGRIPPSEVDERLGEIEHLRRPYPRWFVVTAFGALSAGITVMLGGNALTAAIAFAAAGASGFVGNLLAHRKVPTFFINLVLALSSVLIAIGVSLLEGDSPDTRVKTSLVIVGGIIGLLPGMSLMVAAREAIGSFAVTAAGRFVELTFATIGIVAGVLLGLLIGDALNVIPTYTVRPGASASTFTVAAVAAGVAAVAAAITYQSPWRLAVVGGTIAGFGFLLYLTVSEWVDSPGAATAVPAIAIGVASQYFSARLRVPAVLVTVPGIIPLLPGLAVYQGLLALSQNEPGNNGIAKLVEAVSIAIALAAGVLLGQLVGGRLMHASSSALLPRAVRQRR